MIFLVYGHEPDRYKWTIEARERISTATKKNKRNKNSAQNVMVQIACKYKRGNKKCIQLHCAGNNMENITIVYIYFIGSKTAPSEKKAMAFSISPFA